MRWRFTLNPDTDNKVISEPIGWTDIEFTLKRDKTWHGVFFEYSLPLEFYDDPLEASKNAYTYIRSIYDADGVEGSVIMKVELACNDTDAFTEEGQWKLNFTSYKEKRSNNCTIELNLEPSGDLMTFRSRYDQRVWAEASETFEGTALTPYSALPLAGVDIPPVTILLASTLNSSNVTGLLFGETDTIVAGAGTADHDVICYTNIALNVGQGYDNEAPTMRDEVTVRNVVPNELVPFADILPLFTVDYGGDYQIKIDFNLDVTIAATTAATNSSCPSTNTFNDYDLRIYLEYGATSVILATQTGTDCYEFPTPVFSVSYNGVQNVTLSPGDEIKIYARIYAHGQWDKLLISTQDVVWGVAVNSLILNLDVLASTIVDSSTADMYLINELGSRILEMITDDRYRFLSNYYGRTNSEPYPAPDNIDGPGSLRALTKGLIIRQSILGVYYMSFEEFFEGLNAIDNIGIGLEDDADRAGYKVVRCEEAPYFYKPDLLLTIDKVPVVEILVLQDEHYSIFKCGYTKWETEDFYGLDEIHAQREYRTTLSTVKNTMEQNCQFVASSYAIELTRRNLYDVGTKLDWRYDNDFFIFCMKRGSGAGVYEVEQGNITASGNLTDSSTVLNYRISPVRNAMRWFKTIANSYRDQVNALIDFVVGTGNTIASGLMTGAYAIENAVMAEDADVDPSVFADPVDARPIYLPELWSFDFPMSLTHYNSVKANPTGTIRARFGQEVDYRDFYIRLIGYRPNKGMATFQLLPQRAYPVDPCTIYILQTRGTGTDQIGSALFVGADVNNLFVFVGGELQKMYDVNPSNNEIISFDDTTGYFTLDAPVPDGTQITIIHIPAMGGDCDACVHRFDGNGSGAAAVTLTGFGSGSLSNMFVFYNGNLMKYNDTNPANNELVSYVSGTEVLTFAGPTNANRELRVFGFANCTCIKTFSGKGDGTTSPSVTGLGTDVTLGNTLFFYNGNLQVYNDSDPANNDITLFSTATNELFFNNPTNANRELRAVKLVNC